MVSIKALTAHHTLNSTPGHWDKIQAGGFVDGKTHVDVTKYGEVLTQIITSILLLSLIPRTHAACGRRAGSME